MAKRKVYQTKIKANIDDLLLGETVWVGTEVQRDAGLLSEGLVVKEHPTIKVILDGMEESIVYHRDSIWIRNPEGRNGRPVRW